MAEMSRTSLIFLKCLVERHANMWSTSRKLNLGAPGPTLPPLLWTTVKYISTIGPITIAALCNWGVAITKSRFCSLPIYLTKRTMLKCRTSIYSSKILSTSLHRQMKKEILLINSSVKFWFDYYFFPLSKLIKIFLFLIIIAWVFLWDSFLCNFSIFLFNHCK